MPPPVTGEIKIASVQKQGGPSQAICTEKDVPRAQLDCSRPPKLDDSAIPPGFNNKQISFAEAGQASGIQFPGTIANSTAVGSSTSSATTQAPSSEKLCGTIDPRHQILSQEQKFNQNDAARAEKVQRKVHLDEMPAKEPSGAEGSNKSTLAKGDVAALPWASDLESCPKVTWKPQKSTRITPSPMTRPMAHEDRNLEVQYPNSLQHRTEPLQGKVLKQQKATKDGVTPTKLHGGASARRLEHKVYNSDQLFKMFMFRRHKEDEQRQSNVAELQKKNTVLETMSTEITALNRTLEESRQSITSRETELQQCRQKLARFKEKAGNLQKFVDGLNRDQQKLQLGAKKLESQLQSLRKDKADSEAASADERRHYEDVVKAKTKSLSKARAEIAELKQQIQQQDEDLQHQNERLDYEQQRNDALEQELSEVSSRSRRTLENIQSNHSAIMARLDSLPDKEILRQAVIPSVSPQLLHSTLQRIAGSLNELGSNSEASAESLQTMRSDLKTSATRCVAHTSFG